MYYLQCLVLLCCALKFCTTNKEWNSSVNHIGRKILGVEFDDESTTGNHHYLAAIVEFEPDSNETQNDDQQKTTTKGSSIIPDMNLDEEKGADSPIKQKNSKEAGIFYEFDMDKVYENIDEADKDKTDKDKADKDKNGKDKTDKDKNGKDKTDKDEADKDKAAKDKADKDKADKDKADEDKADKDNAKQNEDKDKTTNNENKAKNKNDYMNSLPFPPLESGIPTDPFIYTDSDEKNKNADNDGSTNEHFVDSNFVALLEIVFTNGFKRSCTGAIIHNNAVVTAAHCFIVENNEYVTPEMALSFVIIGTQPMFDIGYEEYLPIERIVTHPRYQGWTADLAIVLTFAEMTLNKPGRVISMLETPQSIVDSNVTVYSWGRCTDNDDEEIKQLVTKKRRKTTKHNIRGQTRLNLDDDELLLPKTTLKVDTMRNHREHADKSYISTHRSYRRSIGLQLPKTTLKVDTMRNNSEHADKSYSSTHRSYRRSIGSQHNNLSVETFNLVNVHTCTKFLERTVPPIYRIKNKAEVTCFTSEETYLTVEDSGAPVVYSGKLVAITVGGVGEGERHIAVAMKIACFCFWLSEQLPENGKKLKCCKKCCDGKTGEKKTTAKTHLREDWARSGQREMDYYDEIEIQAKGPPAYDERAVPEERIAYRKHDGVVDSATVDSRRR